MRCTRGDSAPGLRRCPWSYGTRGVLPFPVHSGVMERTNAGLPSIEEQLAECQQWAAYFLAAGYRVEHVHDFAERDQPRGFDEQWIVYVGERQLASFDIDGCGASWHGPDALWLRVIGPHVGVTA